MLNETHLERVFGIGQLYCKRNKERNIILLVAKVTDDFLVAGAIPLLHEFTKDLKSRFIVGKSL